MKKSHIIIKQPAGLGDIFFLQKMAQDLLQTYEKVIWPINDEFMFIKKYLISPNIEYIEKSKVVYEGDSVDLQHTRDKFPGGLMASKYNSLGMDCTNWLDYFNFNRDYDSEQRLFKKLNLIPDEDYIWVSDYFGSYPHDLIHRDLGIKTNKRIIKSEFIEGFNLFDWCGVLEHAKEIYMIDTSFNYIIEKIDVTDNLFLYSRYNSSDFSHIKGIFKKPWTYCV